MDSTTQAKAPLATATYPSAAATTAASATEAEAATAKDGSYCVNPNSRTSTSKNTSGTISDRFLHSEENTIEYYESTDDDEVDTDCDDCCEDDEEDKDDKEEFHRKATAFSRSPEGVMRALSNHSLPPPSQQQQQTNSSDRSAAAEQRLDQRHIQRQQQQQHRQKKHQWAHRQLYRSVSVDDLMEYQREFSLASVGRTSSDHSINTQHTTTITEYQREFQAILAGQQHEILRNNTPSIREESHVAIASPTNHRQVSRKSIANSDLAEFKRQFCQMADQQQGGDNKKEADNTRSDNANTNNKKGLPKVDSKVLSDKLETLQKDTTTMDYQWGTRSLRRAILGSDLGTFERSVRTALLETSRENSSDSLIVGSDDDDDDNDNVNDQGECNDTTQDSSNNGPLVNNSTAAEQPKDEEDWGTRSLRKSLKELDCLNDSVQQQSHSTGPAHRSSNGSASGNRPMSNICEDDEISELELPLDSPLQFSSPWQDDKKSSPSVNGLKMPRRVTSNESAQGLGESEDRQANSNNSNNNPDDKSSTSATSPSSSADTGTTQSRSSSMNDMVSCTPDHAGGNCAAGGPEFEWKMRSRFRRSISSSDIEKYQRHLTALEEDSERLSDTEDGGDDQSVHTIAVVESVQAKTFATAFMPESVNTHPLLGPASASSATTSPWDPSDEKKSSSSSSFAATAGNDDAIPKKPKRDRKPRRRHRRSTSDEPELHMENVISDVAPRKPTRTNSRPISPPPPRPAVVRFADNFNQVVEIPKVSEEMKPFLFYTKRDVKRFRMNEHRRQEEQIRSYMEYLNQKENALDASPCW